MTTSASNPRESPDGHLAGPPEAFASADSSSAQALLPEVYEELRRLAGRYLALQKPGQTLQPTALVHEAFLRLTASRGDGWAGRAHFYAAAAQAMRHILVDRARRRQVLRHGGGRVRVNVPDQGLPARVPGSDRSHGLEAHAPDLDRAEELLALDAALQRFREVNQRMYDVVMLRHFAGLTLNETADLLGISPATVKRDWVYAKAWLYAEMNRSTGPNR